MQVYNVTKELNSTIALVPLDLSKVKYIIIHHAAASKCRWEDINLWHKQNGWGCCGYNEIIYKNGDVYICRGDNVGAQCKGYNSISYGISLVGDFNKDIPSVEQIKSLVERFKYHKKRFSNQIKIVGHRELGQTDCPGKNISIESIIKEVDKVEELTVVKALNILQEKEVISSPEYWIKATEVVKYLDKLIINMANKLK